MPEADIWDLFFLVGQPDHLAIAEGINRQPEDPLAYANSVLADCESPILTPNEFRAGVRRLAKASALKKEGGALRLTPEGKEALELNLHWPRKGGRLMSPAEIEASRG